MAATYLYKPEKWLLSALLLGILLPGAPALGGEACEKATISVQATAATADPMGAYNGTALITMGEGEYAGEVVINPVSMRLGEDGAIHMEFQNQFYIPALDSTMDCHDKLVLVPTDDPYLYQINNRAYVQGGTGAFSEAYGRLIAHGTMNVAQGYVEVEAKGRICDVTELE